MDIEDNLNSILNSIKGLLGIMPDDKSFDLEIILHINSVFSILRQLGVGSENGFRITDEDDQWSDFLSDEIRLAAVKDYMFMKVKIIFDPPASSALLESYKELIKEFEWRAYIEADTMKMEENQNG